MDPYSINLQQEAEIYFLSMVELDLPSNTVRVSPLLVILDASVRDQPEPEPTCTGRKPRVIKFVGHYK